MDGALVNVKEDDKPDANLIGFFKREPWEDSRLNGLGGKGGWRRGEGGRGRGEGLVNGGARGLILIWWEELCKSREEKGLNGRVLLGWENLDFAGYRVTVSRSTLKNIVLTWMPSTKGFVLGTVLHAFKFWKFQATCFLFFLNCAEAASLSREL